MDQKHAHRSLLKADELRRIKGGLKRSLGGRLAYLIGYAGGLASVAIDYYYPIVLR
jgi:hypothetical protein